MPELKLAPSPSPVVTAIDPAASANAPPAAGVSAAGPNDQAATSFTAVLQSHLAQPAEGLAAKGKAALLGMQGTADALLAASTAAAAADDPAADPQADALAFLAQMLAGIVPAQSAVAATTPEHEGKDAAGGEDITASLLIAAAVPIAPVAVSPVSAPTTLTPSQSGQLLSAHDATAQPAAILAAATPVATETPAETGNTGSNPQAGFESLLTAARESPTTVAANNAVAAHASAPLSTPVVTAVATPVGVRGWDNEIGEKLTWMVGRQETRAELVLNPPQLGRIEVSLSLNGDQANAVFVSANPAVREALENAVPRLREILQGAGISLGQAQVGAESFQQQANNRENGDNPSRAGNRDTDAIADGFIAGGSTPAQWLRRGNGLVDTFA